MELRSETQYACERSSVGALKIRKSRRSDRGSYPRVTFCTMFYVTYFLNDKLENGEEQKYIFFPSMSLAT
jgi:hypothetical protein